MDKRVILAVAGSGKTTHIVEALDPSTRPLLITYTDNNLSNLRTKILQRFGYFPDNVSLITYFTFLYTFCFKPFLWQDTRAKGINWKIPPPWTLRLKRNRREYYFDGYNRLYHNRIAKYLDFADVSDSVIQRIEKYYDCLFVDEVQDFAGHDYNFLGSISQSKVDLLFVGDFYQHTFDTSRDGAVNRNLHSDFGAYTGRFQAMGLTVDCDTLGKSHRCSPTVCTFISEKLGIEMASHRNDHTAIHLVETEADADRLLRCSATIKLFYQQHHKYNCYSKNWGDSKGEDHYVDVCVVLNKTTLQKFREDKLIELSPQTRNKFYVACSRTRNDMYLVPEDLFKGPLEQRTR